MDDLLDLNFSSSGSSSKPAAPLKPAHLKSSSSKPDPWLSSGLLAPQAAPSSANPPPQKYSSTNLFLANINGNHTPPITSSGRSSTPNTASRSSTPAASGSSAKVSSDAFAGLLSLDASSSALSSAPQRQSLAERQAQQAREAKERDEKERAAFDFSSWGAATPLASGPSASRVGNTQPAVTPASHTKAPTIADFGIFDDEPPRQTDRVQPKPTPQLNVPTQYATSTLSDFSIFDDSPRQTTSRSPISSKPTTQSPPADPTAGWFQEFGSASSSHPSSGATKPDGTDHSLSNGSSSIPRRQPSATARHQTKRSGSPPPHVIGQLVEMGFSPLQARQALSKTDSGENVEAALEMLLREASSSDQPSAKAEDEAAERRRRRRQGPSRATVDRSDARSEAPAPNINVQADKILAQASEIGLNMFTKANSLWNTGKERAQKLYEERAAALQAENARRSGNASPANHDGRPRWMVQAEEEERDRREPAQKVATPVFQDSDDEEGPEEATRQRVQNRRAPAKPAPATSLFDDEPRPVRRSTPRPAAPPSAPKKVRPTISVNPSEVQQSLTMRNKGNDTFKLGRFGEAIEQYTAALDALPQEHLLRIPLWNNRAAAHLKQGEHEDAARDCTSVITLIGLDYHPAKEEPPQGEASEIKLPEGLFKAVSKRASAYEMAEKWEKAKADWEFLMGSPVAAVVFAGGPQHRKMVSDGLARSKKMLAPAPPAPKASAAPLPKAAPPKPTIARASQGVAKMRQAAAAAESEDNLRLQLKDSVDSRITMWSAGKTTNLRALLGSLDMVLWPELALKKVSMADLIAEKQVKIAYMRVIGKLHPDKVSLPASPYLPTFADLPFAAESVQHHGGATNDCQRSVRHSQRSMASIPERCMTRREVIKDDYDISCMISCRAFAPTCPPSRQRVGDANSPT